MNFLPGLLSILYCDDGWDNAGLWMVRTSYHFNGSDNEWPAPHSYQWVGQSIQYERAYLRTRRAHAAALTTHQGDVFSMDGSGYSMDSSEDGRRGRLFLLERVRWGCCV